jgi:aminomuconate-semialdehyde/2-hydroxymuconate-6-semialdehyde dehydrogenase
MHSPLDFIKSLQEAKRAQEQWAKIPLDQRFSILEKLKVEIKKLEMADELAKQQALPIDFVKANEYVDVRLEMKETTAMPTGMIALLLPEKLALRFLLQKALPALFAGNGVVIKTHPQNSFPGLIFKAIAKDLPEHLVSIFHGDDELGSLIASHPGIHAVCASGKSSSMEKILKASLSTFKKVQLHGDYHNSALILNEIPLAEVVEPLIHSAFTGQGMLRFNVNNIFVTELRLAEFENQLKGALEQKNLMPIPDRELQRINDIKNKARAENGKVIVDIDQGPLVIRDMSHCSTLQLECLSAPILMISPVKYVHEMVKWTNTGSLGEMAQIFGPKDKILKFGAQLEVGNIVDSSWIEGHIMRPGSKQSFYGISDERPFGAFFSNEKVFARGVL